MASVVNMLIKRYMSAVYCAKDTGWIIKVQLGS